MKQNLIAHGQLNPLIAMQVEQRLELVDGFKRLFAAKAIGWTSLQVAVRSFDERGQWAAMLMLNRGSPSMTILEEGLVLVELKRTGMSQSELSSLVDRDKSWVSRRIGLVERLHPELIESIKIGVLHPGVARRLLALPPGNQLEIAAAARQARLGVRETEILVSLWSRAKDNQRRKAILYDPRAAIRAETARRKRTIDPRLSPTGQELQRSLRRFEAEGTRTLGLLKALARPEDIQLLAEDLLVAKKTAQRLVTALGSAASNESAGEPGGRHATSGSSTSTTRERETAPSHASSPST